MVDFEHWKIDHPVLIVLNKKRMTRALLILKNFSLLQ